MILSTRIGQTNNLVPTAFLKDNCGNVYFAGFQVGAGLPLTPNAYQVTPGGFWLSVLSGDFSTLVYATYMGAGGDHVDGGTSRFDPQGIIYHSVCTASTNQYQSPGCYSPTNMAGSWDVASFKFNFELSGVVAGLTLSPNDSGCSPHTVNFTNTSLLGVNFLWNFGDGDTSTQVSPSHTYTTPGIYVVSLIAYNMNTCIPTDTATTVIKVIQSVDATFTTDIVLDCIDDTVHYSLVDTSQNCLFAWNFGNGALGTGKTHSVYYINQNIYTVTCIATNGFCHDTFQTVINLFHPIDAVFGVNKDSICLGDQIVVSANPVPLGFSTLDWDFGDGTLIANGTVVESHYYTVPGLYTIKLTVTDTLGCTDTMLHNVFVDKPAYVDFTATDSVLCVGQPVFLRDTLAPHTVWYEWIMDDGTIIKNQHNPFYSWQTAGTYVLSLVGHYYKCPDDTAKKNIIVHDFPKVNLGKDTSI